jgi:hypothetical protein
MAHTQQFTIGNVTYNAVRASAVDQDRLLSIIADHVTVRGLNLMKIGGGELSDRELVPMFLSMPQEFKAQIVTVLMGRVVVHGTETLIGRADFDGRMVEYNTLLSQLLQWNLADFFTWLGSVLSADLQPAPTAENQAQ